MFINAQGSIGIGTTNPATKLDILSASPAVSVTPAGYGGRYRTVLGSQSGAQGILIFGNNGVK